MAKTKRQMKFDNQGKRKDQVESSYKIFFYSLVAMLGLIIIKGIKLIIELWQV